MKQFFSFTTFSAKRVRFILEIGSKYYSEHVSFEPNPTDIASHGLRTLKAGRMNLWLNGPEFLLQNELDWL